MEEKMIKLFSKYNEKYFQGILESVILSWSLRMTLCTGKTYFKQRNNKKICSIKLSKPLLMQRPYEDTINTLLHEMIHAYLFLKYGKECGNSHGEEFKKHMNRINRIEGTKIRVYHNFHKEVNKFRVHIYKCNGPCQFKKPFYGIIRRAISRPPGPEDKWWSRHNSECGGIFNKVHEAQEERTRDLPVIKAAAGSSNEHLLKRQDEPGIENKKFFCLSNGNVNINYSSSVKNLEIKKYLRKYFEHNQKAADSFNNSKVTKFRHTLNLNVEKYVRNMKNSLKNNSKN